MTGLPMTCTCHFSCWNKTLKELRSALGKLKLHCAGDKECEDAMWAAIQRLTLEQLGQGTLDLLSKSISEVQTCKWFSHEGIIHQKAYTQLATQASERTLALQDCRGLQRDVERHGHAELYGSASH